MNEVLMNAPLEKNPHTWEERRKICEEWKASEKSKNKFCAEKGLALPTFCGWCKRVWPELNKKKASKNLLPIMRVNKKIGIKKEEPLEQTRIKISLLNQATLRFQLPLKNLVTFIQELSYAVTTLR